MSPQFLLLLLAFGLLIAATAATWLLTATGRADVALMRNVVQRIRAWWVMVGVLGLALVLGDWALILLFAVLSGLALREVLAVTLRPDADRLAIMLAYAVILPVQYLLILVDWYGLFAVFIPVYAFLLLPVIAALRASPDGFLDRVAGTQWGLMIAVFCLSHLPALVMLDFPGPAPDAALLVAWVIIVVQLSDVLQFVWGKVLGRRLIAPRLSPSKTWEGFLGGALCATLVGTALWWLTPFTPVWAAIMAGLLTLLGFLGGLVLSAVKRDRGVKDWGHLVPGHGGVTDRIDSLVFSAPLFFHLTRWGWSLS